MRYETLLFDLDDTLFDSTVSFAAALLEAAAESGLAVPEDFAERYERIHLPLWRHFENGEISRETARRVRFERLFAECGLSGDPAAFGKKYMEKIHRSTALMDGAAEVCRELSRDHHLYVASNGDQKMQAGRMEQSRLAPYFSGIFTSDLLGAEKPSRVFYDTLLQKIGNPDRRGVLMIGDAESDITGGIAAEVDTCLICGIGKTPPDCHPTCRISSLRELPALV